MSEVEFEAQAPGGRDEAGRDGRAFANLSEALAARRFPIENHDLIRRIVGAVGATQFADRSGYVKATSESAALHISFGYTNGIPSEAAARAILEAQATPGAAVYKSKRDWGIAHPVNAIRESGRTRSERHRRDYGTCPACFTKIFANGTCGCD